MQQFREWPVLRWLEVAVELPRLHAADHGAPGVDRPHDPPHHEEQRDFKTCDQRNHRNDQRVADHDLELFLDVGRAHGHGDPGRVTRGVDLSQHDFLVCGTCRSRARPGVLPHAVTLHFDVGDFRVFDQRIGKEVLDAHQGVIGDTERGRFLDRRAYGTCDDVTLGQHLGQQDALEMCEREPGQ